MDLTSVNPEIWLENIKQATQKKTADIGVTGGGGGEGAGGFRRTTVSVSFGIFAYNSRPTRVKQ